MNDKPKVTKEEMLIWLSDAADGAEDGAAGEEMREEWARDHDETLSPPSIRAEYERDLIVISSIRQVIQGVKDEGGKAEDSPEGAIDDGPTKATPGVSREQVEALVREGSSLVSCWKKNVGDILNSPYRYTKSSPVDQLGTKIDKLNATLAPFKKEEPK